MPSLLLFGFISLSVSIISIAALPRSHRNRRAVVRSEPLFCLEVEYAGSGTFRSMETHSSADSGASEVAMPRRLY